MHYIDSGSRDAAQVVGAWLQQELTPDVVELRWQTGYFVSDALGLFAPTLQGLAACNQTVRVLIGSNQSGTVWNDVLQLAGVLGIPRPNADLGVVRYVNALFHPKTYHLLRSDGTQCAYVGSSNLTVPGLSSLNIEAGIIVDTRGGDPAALLDQIASAIDAWFTENRDGLHPVSGLADVERLRDEGVLALAPPPRPPAPPGAGGAGGAGGRTQPRLRRIFRLPRFTAAPAVPVPPPVPAVLPQFAAIQQFFPAPFVIDWSIVGPTHAASALSSATLPGGAVGLVVRLPRPVIKGILGQGGTPSLTVPMDTLASIRFAVAQARTYLRPSATFELWLRYLGDVAPIIGQPVVTNVLPYGYLPGESSHKEVRLRIPKQSLNLIQQIRHARLRLPSTGDFALLEWPTWQRRTSGLLSLSRDRTCSARLSNCSVPRSQTDNSWVTARAGYRPGCPRPGDSHHGFRSRTSLAPGISWVGGVIASSQLLLDLADAVPQGRRRTRRISARMELFWWTSKR